MNTNTPAAALAPVAAARYDPAMTPGQGRDGPRKPRAKRSTAFGRKLTAERRRRGWTQEQLAEKLGVDLKSVQRWESGAAAPKALADLEAAVVVRRALDAFLAGK